MSPNIVVGRAPELGPRTVAGGGMIVEHLEIESGAASNLFTISVPADTSLIIWGWWQVLENTDLFMSIEVDGVPLGPNVNALNPSNADPFHWPAAISATVAGLSAGSHTVALVSDGVDPTPAGMTIWYVPNASYRSQVNS